MRDEFETPMTSMDELLGRELLEAAHAFEESLASLRGEFANWHMIDGAELYHDMQRAIDEIAATYQHPPVVVKMAWEAALREGVIGGKAIDYEYLDLSRLFRHCMDRARDYERAHNPHRHARREHGHFDMFGEDDPWMEED